MHTLALIGENSTCWGRRFLREADVSISNTVFLGVLRICTLDLRRVVVWKIVLLVRLIHFVGVTLFSLGHITIREEIPAEAFVDTDVSIALDDGLD